MIHSCELINGAANTVASSACWSRFSSHQYHEKEVIAYSLDNLIAIVDPQKSSVVETLRGHDKRINALKSSRNFLVSASEDTTVRIWRIREDKTWEQHSALSGIMRSSVIALACLDAAGGVIVAASDVSGRLAVWFKGSSTEAFTIIQVIDMPAAQTAHELHLTESPGLVCTTAAVKSQFEPDILLFIGSVDTKIHIRLASSQNISTTLVIGEGSHETRDVFKSVGTLPGHEEWITCLASVRIDNQTILLASGSKDCKIRLWRIHFLFKNGTADASNTPLLDNFDKLCVEDDDDEDEDEELDAKEGTQELEPDESLSEARLIFSTTGFHCSVFLEALLIGHEDWVTSVHWMMGDSDSEPCTSSEKGSDKIEKKGAEIGHRLYSTCMDRNMVVWTPEYPSGVWVPIVRVGDIGGQLGGSVGGNLLGFVGGCLSPDYQRMLGIGYGGSFHLWKRKKASTDDNDAETWSPKSFPGGHFESVNDLIWTAGSDCLVTVSSDQTSRLVARVEHRDSIAAYDNNSCEGGHLLSVRAAHTNTTSSSSSSSNGESASSGHRISNAIKSPSAASPHSTSSSSSSSTHKSVTGISTGTHTGSGHRPWREVSRPQIHGYELYSVAVSPHTGKHILYSSGDEKLLRVFDASSCVLDGLKSLCGVNGFNFNFNTADSDTHTHSIVPRVTRAYIPELGLSNKAAESMSALEKSEMEARNVQTLDWSFAPLEGQLADYTVWPEVQKMYGHNNGVVCISLSHCGKWLASSCKARDRETATILLWNMNTYCCVGSLDGHDSTVVCLSFSPTDRYLASSGKDRTLCINISSPDAAALHCPPYSVAVVVPAAHKRIVWTSSWCNDGSLLATGSRDGVCKIWAVSSSLCPDSSVLKVDCVCLHSFNPFSGVSVTALAFGPPLGLSLSNWVLACGAESGDINYWDLGPVDSRLIYTVKSSHCHGSTVKKLAWAPDSLKRPFFLTKELVTESKNTDSNVSNVYVSNQNSTNINGTDDRGSVSSAGQTDMQGTADPLIPSWRIASCGEDHTVRIFRIAQTN